MVLVLAVLLCQPTLCAFSLREDPRYGKSAWPDSDVGVGQGESAPYVDGWRVGATDSGAAAATGAVGGPDDGPLFYVVRPGDTLSGISSRHGISVTGLWIANRLRNPHWLQPGQSLVIPRSEAEALAGMQASETASGPSVKAAGNAARRSMAWPAYGSITSGFGRRGGSMHEGLDIACPRGLPVLAAAAGTVKSLGWMGNYGRAVIVDHGGGLCTLYAHCDKLLVRRGQHVDAGQQIAAVGSTGRSTGPHLHFEVMINGQRRDPLDYLL